MYWSDWLSAIEVFSDCDENTAKFWILVSQRTQLKKSRIYSFLYPALQRGYTQPLTKYEKCPTLCIFLDYAGVFYNNKTNVSSCKANVCGLLMKVSLCTVT